MEQKIITARHASDLNALMAKMISEGWTPVGEHKVVVKHEQLQFAGMQHKRTQYDVEYSQTIKKG